MDLLAFDPAVKQIITGAVLASLDETRQFVREGRLMQFRAGRIVPVGAR